MAAWPIAAAGELTALAGAGVLIGVATAIAAATGCAVLAAAFAAAAAVAASVVAVALSSPSLALVDDVFAGAADALDGICVGSAGGGASFGAAGFACVSELFGPLAAFVLVVALLGGGRWPCRLLQRSRMYFRRLPAAGFWCRLAAVPALYRCFASRRSLSLRRRLPGGRKSCFAAESRLRELAPGWRLAADLPAR